MENEKKNSKLAILANGLLKENPSLRLVLDSALCNVEKQYFFIT